ncbi:hypothetical protein [Agrobacterium leguminum]|uniref:hypothetical protein n=1 Tax=Agrobacterium leguminum TaxID=2792015 RepID=UPI003CE50E5D
MTYRAKLAMIATVAVLVGISTMFLYHSFGPVPHFVTQADFNGIPPMTGMWNEMGWMMLFGPLAMVLTFGGFVVLAILLITSLTHSSPKPD